MTDLIRLDSRIESWNSCGFKFDGVPFNGITSVEIEHTRERKLVYGAKRDGVPLGMTSGKYAVKGFSITMLRASWDRLSTQLTLKGLGSYGDAEFVFSASYFETAHVPILAIVSGCHIVGEKDANAEGTDELLTELSLMALVLEKNGKRLHRGPVF